MPLELEPFDAERHGAVDAALVCYPHGAAAPTVAALRERGVKVVDLSADFRLHDRGIYEDWYSPTARRSSSARASTACPSCTATTCAAPSSSPTPAATRPRR